MRLERLHRWQWVLISLFVGFVVGMLRSQLDDPVGGYKNFRNDNQRDFEMTLARTPLKKEYPYIKNIQVVRLTDAYGSAPKEYAVTFQYWDGVPRRKENADPKDKQAYAIYEPMFFLPELPYKPLIRAGKSTTMPAANWVDRTQALAERLKLKRPDPPNSVMSYLEALAVNKRIDGFTYRWWITPKIQLAAWMTGCFVVIGLIWPTVINVIAYGRLTRPPEEKAKLKAAREAKQKARAEMTAAEMARLAAMNDALEAKLKAGAGARVATDEAPKTEQPVKQLTATELEMAQVAREKEVKQFGGKEDDFYPVERRGKQ